MAKTKLTHKLWAKIIAFVLLVLFVPLVCGSILNIAWCVHSGYYGSGEQTFFETGGCYYGAVTMAEEAMSAGAHYLNTGEDAFRPVSQTNFRFVLKNAAGKEIYSTYTGEGVQILDAYTDIWYSGGDIRLFVDGYVLEDMPVQDDFFWENLLFEVSYSARYAAIWTTALGTIVAIVLFIFLTCGAGHRGDTDEPVASWLEKIPFDIYTVISFVLLCLCVMLVEEFAHIDEQIFTFGGIALVLIPVSAILLSVWLTFVARIKLGILLKSCIVWKTCAWSIGIARKIFAFFSNAIQTLPLIWKSILIYGAFVLANIIIAANYSYYNDFGFWFLLFVIDVFVLFVVGASALQMSKLKNAGEALASGNLDSKLDTEKMYWEFKQHGEKLNSISDGMAKAVEQQMKSERLKTELITNVSHDIKTPLTSIINYIDLLQKEHTPEEEREYLAVLDRQSKRLKKLTEDLVEASKASTGNMNVDLAVTNVKEMIDQSLGEYAEKLYAGKLETVITVTEDMSVMADGRASLESYG